MASKNDITVKNKTKRELLEEYWKRYVWFYHGHACSPWYHQEPDMRLFKELQQYEKVLGEELCRGFTRAKLKRECLINYDKFLGIIRRDFFISCLYNTIVSIFVIGYFLFFFNGG